MYVFKILLYVFYILYNFRYIFIIPLQEKLDR